MMVLVVVHPKTNLFKVPADSRNEPQDSNIDYEQNDLNCT